MSAASRALPSRRLGHEADRPRPARELARGGHVRLVLVDAALEQRLAPRGQPAHALRRMPPRRRVRNLARRELLGVRRAVCIR